MGAGEGHASLPIYHMPSTKDPMEQRYVTTYCSEE